MTEAAPACDAHRALVDAALGPDPGDDVLERFALEAAECPACRRAVAGRLGVHPIVLDRAARGPGLADPAGMRKLRTVLRAPVRRWPLWVAAIAAAAALATAVAWTASRSTPSGASVVAHDAPPASVAPAPTVEPVPRPRPAPGVVQRAPRLLPAPIAPAPIAAADDAVAVAEPADDWPAPPFEELRGGRPKSTDAPLRAVQLVLSGDRHVGGRVELTVVASSDTPLAVCVTGPERGVVWRGGVPAGRTDLSRGGRLQAFGFAAPGTYRFALSTSDMDRCAAPVHIVEVEVSG